MLIPIINWTKVLELLTEEWEKQYKEYGSEKWAKEYLQIPIIPKEVCKTDSYSPTPGKALDVTAIEGNTMDLDSRIKYNEPMGNWKVLFNGKLIKHDFKSSAAAHAHLQDLKEKRKEPEYVK